MGKKMKIQAVLMTVLAMLIFLFGCGVNKTVELDDSVIYQDVQDYITERMGQNSGISDFTVTQKSQEENRIVATCEVTYGPDNTRAKFSLEYTLEKKGWVLETCGAEMDEVVDAQGNGVTWELDEDGVLTISGAGEMDDYEYSEGEANTPWWEERDRVQSVIIANGVTSIGAFAFHSCRNLTSIAIPDSIHRLGNAAFASCGLTHIIFEGDVPEFGDYVFLGVTATAFYPDNLSSWTDTVMQNYSGFITWMELSEGEMTSLLVANQLAGGTCGPELNWTLNEDGILLISGTGKMDEIHYSYTSKSSNAPWWDVRDRIQIVLLTNGVTSISDYAFYNCGNLSSIKMSDGIIKMGDSTFVGCEKLTHATISGSLYYWDFQWMLNFCTNLGTIDASPTNESFASINGVLFNKDKTELVCYPRGRTDSSYTIPDGVTKIGYGAFSDCEHLCSVIIPDSVTEIGEFAFSDCSNLSSLVVPNGVTEISSGMFIRCTNLTRVTIPDSVTKIGPYAFQGCASLTSITIPDGVTEIGDRAFYGCTGLSNVTIPDGVTRTGDIGLNNEKESVPEKEQQSETTKLRESYVTAEGIQILACDVPYQIDLDQDGTTEQVETKLTASDVNGPYPSIQLEINGVDYSEKLENMYQASPYFAVIDIDPDDGKMELALQDYGPSVDYITFFYHYEAGELKYLGCAPGLFEDSAYDKDFMDYGIHLQGDGRLQTYFRADLLQTWHFQVTYELKEETLKRLSEDLYIPMEVGSDEWRAEQRGTVIWPKEDMRCYRTMDSSTECIVLPANTKITLIGASEIAYGESSWVKFKRNDTEETFYLFIRALEQDQHIEHQLQLADGTWVFSMNSFENTLLYD